MPSPLGHALGGAAAGWAVAGPAVHRQPAGIWRSGALFAALAMLPDLDLLVAGVHRGPTHSLGAAVIAGLIVGAVTRNGRMGLAGAAAYASHILLDWMGSDSSPPIGVMALWPISRAYFESSLHVFGAISRRYWLAGFWAHNAGAVIRELLILLPVAWVIFLVRRVERRDQYL